MSNLSIKTKIMLWFSCTLLIIVLLITALTFEISRSVLNEDIRQRLINAVNTNVAEIEYYNSIEGLEQEAGDQYLRYGGGYLEIDDDFCDYTQGIYTGLYDNCGALLYGEEPIVIPESLIFTFTNVKPFKYEGETYYIYEKRLSGEKLKGLWLRGIVSQNESTNILYNVLRLSFWLLPVLVLITIIGGYFITRKCLRPINEILLSAEKISQGSDLSLRLDLGPGKDEIHNLAHVFNSMLERLEKSFNTEKQFTSDVSHELRTPASVIMAQSEYALELAKTPDEYKESLEIIKFQAINMSQIISQLLFFTRLEQGVEPIEKNAFNFSQMVESTCSQQKLLSQKNITVRTFVDENIIFNGDENLLRRLLNNMIDNAYKYGKQNGTTTVSLFKSNDNICLSVADDGIGISQENLQKIWNRFYQADQSRSGSVYEKGLGLGLTIAAEITRLHNGTFRTESKPGEGSKFIFIFPKK